MRTKSLIKEVYTKNIHKQKCNADRCTNYADFIIVAYDSKKIAFFCHHHEAEFEADIVGAEI
jgi:hypothetical protein